MHVKGPIVVIEDDLDDQEILSDAFKEMGVESKLIFFDNTVEAYEYLRSITEQPFLIFSDVNLPGQSGIEFKRQIDNEPSLREKSIPFVFFSTSVKKEEVDTAYKEMTVQGYFKKPTNYADLKSILHKIMEYWKICKHPNT